MIKNLTIAPNWVGDTVLAIPVFEALSSGGRSVTVLAQPHLESLLGLVPSVAATLCKAASDTETIEKIRLGDFEEVVVLPNSLRSALLPYRAGIEKRWAYRNRSIEGLLRGLVLNPAIPRPNLRHRHQVDDYIELLAAMEVEPSPNRHPLIGLTKNHHRQGQSLLDRARVSMDTGPVIGLFGGAEFGPSKRWPWKRFVELAKQLRKDQPASQQVILAGPNELWMAVRIHEETGKIHPVIGPDLDLGRFACAIAQLDLLITNDSGPMHLAAALGIPCIALFGPTNPSRTSPVGSAHAVLYSNRWCSPCFRKRCPLIHHGCMKDLSVADVKSRALELLAESKH